MLAVAVEVVQAVTALAQELRVAVQAQSQLSAYPLQPITQ
jgi:hypothetical protein